MIPEILIGLSIFYVVGRFFIRPILSRWYCDTQEYYLKHENENGGIDIHWFNQRSLNLDNRIDEKVTNHDSTID
jgi:hypothetical protein